MLNQSIAPGVCVRVDPNQRDPIPITREIWFVSPVIGSELGIVDNITRDKPDQEG